MLVTDPNNRINSKELYDWMMKSTFDIKEDRSQDIRIDTEYLKDLFEIKHPSDPIRSFIPRNLENFGWFYGWFDN